MKTCARCRKDKDDAEFSRGKYWCKQCDHDYYVENKARHVRNCVAARKRQRLENLKFIWEYKLKHPCVDCGEPDPVVLDFDHVRGRKSYGMAMIYNMARETLLKELEKCEVRCANCHRRKTAKTNRYYRHLVVKA